MKNGGEMWEGEIKKLDAMAKKANEAIISDSLKFSGMSPVKHSRPFILEERLYEAVKEKEEEALH